jgi:hypothetical protein
MTATPASAAILPPANPPDIQPSGAMNQDCWPPASTSSCNAASLASINAARAVEGVGPMILPSNFSSLDAPEQLLVVFNLERVDRGLAPIAGLTPALDQDALAGAAAGTDPPLPAGASSSSSLWLGGYATPLFDDFFWMYDDGPGGVSYDCCWAHREAMLQTFPGAAGDVLMGAAVTSTSTYPDSAGVVVASGVSQPANFTWASEVRYLGFSAGPGTLSLGASPGQTAHGSVIMSASGEAEHFSASIAGGAGQFSLSGPACTAGAGHACGLGVNFRPSSRAATSATLTISGPNGAHALTLRGGPFDGYWLTATDGGIFSYGTAQFAGSTGGIRLVRPVVGIASTTDRNGYWTVASDGGVFSFGDAHFLGSTGNHPLVAPVVGVSADPAAAGYWLVARDGGVFSFGASRFYGSTGNHRLNAPMVAMASTPDGRGYWEVASDGGVFNYGDARFAGSTGNVHLDSPIVGLAATRDGRGYWMVAADGGVFAFGDARFAGSAYGLPLSAPIVGIERSQTGPGYWLVGANGAIFSYGATFHGSAAGAPLARPVVGIAG